MIKVLPESDKHCKGLMGADWWETVGLDGPEACFLQSCARYGHSTGLHTSQLPSRPDVL